MPKVGARHATVEVTGWVTKFVGGDGSGRKLYTEPVAAGDTVRDILRRVSARHPELDAALWDASKRELGENIEVLVNDAVLGISHTLDSELQPGDHLTLVGQYMGG
ncbi:MAG: MoaD/ThiS family protein [Candidatus Rokubacteria bacterium]|nr:MoaD/ThiS family protein [Candidatus Rokubacteria bacterium]